MSGFFNPYFFIPYIRNSSLYNNTEIWQNFHWFSVNLESQNFILAILAICNFAVLNYFIWHGLQRCFRDPNNTMLPQRKSYVFMAYFAIVTIGFAGADQVAENVLYLLFLNFCAFLYLIAAITPHRQSLIDWARYRHINFKNGHVKKGKGLISEDKSPAIVALSINAIIAIVCISSVVIFSGANLTEKVNYLIALGLALSLAILYVVIVQISLFMKTKHRVIASIFILGAVMILPLIVVAVLLREPDNYTFLWLFSALAPVFTLFLNQLDILGEGILAIVCHLAIAGFLMNKFMQRLRIVGESQTKAMMTKELAG